LIFISVCNRPLSSTQSDHPL